MFALTGTLSWLVRAFSRWGSPEQFIHLNTDVIRADLALQPPRPSVGFNKWILALQRAAPRWAAR